MARQILNNLATYGEQRTKINANFEELYNKADAEDSYASLYLNTPEALNITSGTPESLTNISVESSYNFSYVGGSLVYDGDLDIIVKVDGAVSMISGTNNVVTTVSFGKNGTPDPKTEIDRKIGTGADVGAVPIAGSFTLTKGDKLDFFVDVDISSTITVTKANFTIHTLKAV